MIRSKHFVTQGIASKLACTTHTNFDSLKMHIISEPEKSCCSENLL